jgi:hypothetical protein
MGKKKKTVIVPLAEDMPDEDFIKHIEHRHASECKVEGYIARQAVDAWIGTYRAFHERLHKLAVPGQYDHTHDEDDE